jgi:hypothetical protein
MRKTQTSTKIQLSITGGRGIEADVKSIPLSQLKLDPKNVRFRHITRKMSDKEIDEWIYNEADTKSLIREIKYSQGLTEKPYVKSLSDSEYLVIEGNRRIVCLRKIVEEIKSKKEKDIPIEKMDSQQCIVLPKDAEDAEIALFLARAHVSGKKEWNALNKGAHVYDLIRKYDYDYDEVARAISIGKNTISLKVKAYEATLAYNKKYPDDKSWVMRFSHFLELFKQKGLKDWAEDPVNIGTFMEWVHDGKISMAIDVRKLDQIILDGKAAYQAMNNGSTIIDAWQVLKDNQNKQTLTSTLAENVDVKIDELYDLVRNFPRSKMLEVAKNEEKLKNFEELHKEFGQLIKDIKSVGGE